MFVYVSCHLLPCSSIHGSASSSPYRPSLGSPRSTHSNGALLSHSSDTSNGTIANGSTPTSDQNGSGNELLNGSSHSVEDEADDDDDVDMGKRAFYVRGKYHHITQQILALDEAYTNLL